MEKFNYHSNPDNSEATQTNAIHATQRDFSLYTLLKRYNNSGLLSMQRMRTDTII